MYAREKVCKMAPVFSVQFIRFFHRSITMLGGAVVEWISCWLAEQDLGGSNHGLGSSISEIGYLLLPSRDMSNRLLNRRKILKTAQINPITMCGVILIPPSISSRENLFAVGFFSYPSFFSIKIKWLFYKHNHITALLSIVYCCTLESHLRTT